VPRVVKSKEEWKKELSPEEYHVMWEHGTERAFTGDLLKNKKHGVYICRSCKNQLFDSETKFNSGTGWPSFYKPVDEKNVGTDTDTTLFMERTEVHCARCGAHLGHVFPDGPKPTGLRYCINSVSLDFEENK
jgi:peptide-methionine (R)-S-oxide reductase